MDPTELESECERECDADHASGTGGYKRTYGGGGYHAIRLRPYGPRCPHVDTPDVDSCFAADLPVVRFDTNVLEPIRLLRHRRIITEIGNVLCKYIRVVLRNYKNK